MTLREAVYRQWRYGDEWIVYHWQSRQRVYYRGFVTGYWHSLYVVLYSRFLLWCDTNYRDWR